MSWNITKNDPTPISDGAWKRAIDDTGAICRMEPIWETMHALERERAAALWALKKLDAIYRDEMDEPRPDWLQPFFEGLSSSALFGTSLADCNDIEKLRTIAEKLWRLLDDIDTASDMFKPSDLAGYKQFYGYTMKKAADRGKQLESDGYHLYLPND